MKLLAAWIWESSENMPLLLGFVVAARLWQASVLIGLAVLTFGMGLGVLITRLLEPKLHREKHEVRWVSVIINFLLFLALAILFLYYFRAETGWINWKTDLLGGVAAGILLTFVQSLQWIGAKARILVHEAATVIVFSVRMLEMRNTIRMDGWGLSIFYAVVLTLFVSLIIALIDYQEMYRGSVRGNEH